MLLAAHLLLLITAATAAEAITMAHTESVQTNQIQKSLAPMLRVWTRSIGWTIVLSAMAATLFALVLDGCSRIR